MKRGWVHGYGHLREYTMKELTSILQACDFTILRKGFLQPRVIDTLRRLNKKGFFLPIITVYYLIIFMIPQFRTVLRVDCYKPVKGYRRIDGVYEAQE